MVQMNFGGLTFGKDAALKFIGEDTTGGSSNSTDETEIGEVIIPANSVYTGILIIAELEGYDGGTTNGSVTIKVRTGTSNTSTENTERRSRTLSLAEGFGDAYGHAPRICPTVFVWVTAETWTGQVYVHVTTASVDTSSTGYCLRITVLGI